LRVRGCRVGLEGCVGPPATNILWCVCAGSPRRHSAPSCTAKTSRPPPTPAVGPQPPPRGGHRRRLLPLLPRDVLTAFVSNYVCMHAVVKRSCSHRSRPRTATGTAPRGGRGPHLCGPGVGSAAHPRLWPLRRRGLAKQHTRVGDRTVCERGEGCCRVMKKRLVQGAPPHRCRLRTPDTKPCTETATLMLPRAQTVMQSRGYASTGLTPWGIGPCKAAAAAARRGERELREPSQAPRRGPHSERGRRLCQSSAQSGAAAACKHGRCGCVDSRERVGEGAGALPALLCSAMCQNSPARSALGTGGGAAGRFRGRLGGLSRLAAMGPSHQGGEGRGRLGCGAARGKRGASAVLVRV
jgi:hypothetical protein